MTDLLPYPDEVAALIVHLDDLAPAVSYFTNVVEVQPLITVSRFGGADDGLTNYPVVGVDVFAGSADEGEPLAARVHQRMLTSPAVIRVSPDRVVVIDATSTVTSFVEVAWGGDDVRRWTASYRLELRRPRPRSVA